MMIADDDDEDEDEDDDDDDDDDDDRCRRANQGVVANMLKPPTRFDNYILPHR